MRVTGYKLNAKSIINDNIGKCLLSSLILIFPKLIFTGCVIIVWLAYRVQLLNVFSVFLGVSLSLGILFVLNSLCVPIGELILFNLANNENPEKSCEESEPIMDTALDMAIEFAFDLPVSEETKEFYFPLEFQRAFANEEEVASEETETLLLEVLGDVRRFGFVRLIKLRFSLLVNLARDVALTALPAVVLVAGLLTYALYAPLPVGAFGTLLAGSSAILLLAAMELGLEYDKYRYVYLSLPEFAKDFSSYSFPYKSMLEKSTGKASEGIGRIRRCEISFWGWSIFAFAFLPFFVPMLYFMPYKKLTLYNVIM